MSDEDLHAAIALSLGKNPISGSADCASADGESAFFEEDEDLQRAIELSQQGAW